MAFSSKAWGHVTATLQVDPDDTDSTAPILALLRDKVGRVLANGWPTGVEVRHAMVHGGPFRRAGDLHVHFFGTSTLSFSDGVTTQAGDMFEIEADALTLPVRNALVRAPETAPVGVRVL